MALPTATLLSDPKVQKAGIEFATKTVLPGFLAVLKKAADDRKIKGIAERYAIRLVGRVSYCKTFLHHDKPQHIKRVYQPVYLSADQNHSPGEGLLFVLDQGKCVAVVGHAGTGKSMTMKKMCHECIESNHALPIFIELRRLSFTTDDGKRKILAIKEAIANDIFGNITEVSLKFVEKLLEKGGIVVFLDGFDELPKIHRATYANEILILSLRYENVQWVTSTRPDELITRMDHVRVLKPIPLQLDDACTHIDRYDVDREQQEDFKKLLKNKLYAEHPTFASNPLLLAVLFTSFRTHQRVDQRPHIFMDEVYIALCMRHDSRKGGFERELHSGLTREEFDTLVRLFCYVTLCKEQFQFSTSDFNEIVIELMEVLDFKESASAILNDFTQSISLLTEDGLDYIFIHRSLQEYLAVKYVSLLDKEDQPEAFFAIMQDPTQSFGLLLMLGISADLVETHLILPGIKSAIESSKAKYDDSMEVAYCRQAIRALYFREVLYIKSEGPWAKDVSIVSLIELLARLYPTLPKNSVISKGFWWIDPETKQTYKTPELTFEAGLQFFAKHKHFGSSAQVVGFTFAEFEHLDYLAKEITLRISARQDTRKNIRELTRRVANKKLVTASLIVNKALIS